MIIQSIYVNINICHKQEFSTRDEDEIQKSLMNNPYRVTQKLAGNITTTIHRRDQTKHK